MSVSLTYLRYELLRTFRNKRFFILSLGFPLVLYFLIAAPNRHVHNFDKSGISLPLFYMVGLVGFGTMSSMISSGARIAGERTAGWTRQLRVSPLSTRGYFRAKVLTAYMMAALCITLLYLAGVSLGVRLSTHDWVQMTVLILVALLPFAALGVMLGHMLTVDSIGPVTGGLTALLAFISGVWFPISSHGFLHDVSQILPSYWLVQASHVALGGQSWGQRGWIVVAVWTVVLVLLARRAYRRDTVRV